jgi:hypothetical protein
MHIKSTSNSHITVRENVIYPEAFNFLTSRMLEKTSATVDLVVTKLSCKKVTIAEVPAPKTGLKNI